jgi:dihydrofolate reductase
MGKVFVNVGMSLDGYMAPEGMTMEHWDDPGYKNWLNQWMALQSWVFNQKSFRESLKIGEGGETGQDNDIIMHIFKRTGVSIMGKRMFDAGERSWPEEAPFHTPVFVLTHQKRAPWVRPGGTTFYFVNDGIESALRQAREAAGDRDIRISGGADVVQQYLNAGVVEELAIELAPVLFGGGRRLFEGVDPGKFGFKIDTALHSPLVTHLRYSRVTA